MIGEYQIRVLPEVAADSDKIKRHLLEETFNPVYCILDMRYTLQPIVVHIQGIPMLPTILLIKSLNWFVTDNFFR